MRRGRPLALMLCADRRGRPLHPRGGRHARFTRTRKCDDPSGFSRSPERPYLHHVVMPSPIRCNPRSTLDYAASESNVGSLKRSPRTIMAHAIRAILLASATAATLIGRRSMIRASQSRFVPCCRAYRMTAIDPAMSNHRKYRLPCFEIPPRRSLPPVECCFGTRPIQAARLRPDENAFHRRPRQPAQWRRSGPRQGFPRAADFLHMIGARHEYASQRL
jgi:hypothetical protein